MFLPSLGDHINYKLDIIFVTGDAYIDHPSFGVALLGKYLQSKGYKVGVIAQPDIYSDKDIGYFGEPKLFWAVTSGAMDSMVANYTALGKKRKSDDYTPGGVNNKRPDRAVIKYSNLIRQYFKNQTIVIGGIEASLRRLAHYDWWQDKVRRSILLDSKADYLIYGMAEITLERFTDLFKKGELDKIKELRGVCYKDKSPDYGIEVPSFEEVSEDKKVFHNFYKVFYYNTDWFVGKRLIQKSGKTYVVQNPPPAPLTKSQLDEVYSLDYERDAHPYYKKQGRIKAVDMIKFSITSHRGCYGNCNFCALTVHQGRYVISRSHDSILNEAKKISKMKDFKGYISDIGGPTANMFDIECDKKLKYGACMDKDCLYPSVCPALKVNHNSYLSLLKKVQNIPKVKKVFVSSGIRYDMILKDKNPINTLKTLISNNVSGQLKVAPEALSEKVLRYMGKPSFKVFLDFKHLFEKVRKTKTYFVCYLIAAHPGATLEDDKNTGQMIKRELHYSPEQVQIFTPTPSTWSTTMYYTEMDKDGNKIFVEKNLKRKKLHKLAISGKDNNFSGKKYEKSTKNKKYFDKRNKNR
jgi:uncharacterized radical SAM protein YgiQ